MYSEIQKRNKTTLVSRQRDSGVGRQEILNELYLAWKEPDFLGSAICHSTGVLLSTYYMPATEKVTGESESNRWDKAILRCLHTMKK